MSRRTCKIILTPVPISECGSPAGSPLFLIQEGVTIVHIIIFHDNGEYESIDNVSYFQWADPVLRIITGSRTGDWIKDVDMIEFQVRG